MTRTAQDRMLPCPFCRSKDLMMQRADTLVIVCRCKQCGCTKVVVTKYRDQALHEWNMREGVLWSLMDTDIPQKIRHPYRTKKDRP